MEVTLDRNSVAAGDDADRHDVSFEVDARRTIADFLSEIRSWSYLPRIHGGAATWVVRAGDDRRARPIAVMAAQWDSAALLVGPATELAALGGLYYFEYLAQEDPHAVLARLVEDSR